MGLLKGSLVILWGFCLDNVAWAWITIQRSLSFIMIILGISSATRMPQPFTESKNSYQSRVNIFLIFTTLNEIFIIQLPMNIKVERKASELGDENKPTHMNLPVLLYLKEKCGLPEGEIENRLSKGLTFQIKGEGNQLDSSLIEQVLLENDFYEKLNQKQLKDEAMRMVKTTIEEWSLNIARNEKKINKDELPNYTAKVLPFGSHVLDLKSNSSDIDLVCVVPNFVNRDTHFFGMLSQKFEKEPEVKSLSVIKSARVPIITFDYKEINIDISFCKLEEETIPRDIERVINMDLINKILDVPSKTAITGRKNNLMILQLAGAHQLENFKQTLRIIKVWAKNRGINSNAMGFLGGISWAIMLAKICQIFPYHKPSKLLVEFFNIYKLWRWREMPVSLIFHENQITEFQNQKAMMTVYTPCDHYNSTGRVNKITFEIIEKELARASEILTYKRADFQTLCQKIDFFSMYDFFIEIDVCGQSKTREQQKEYQDFLGSVESKILVLLKSIINHNKKDLEKSLKIVPNSKSYKKNDTVYDSCTAYFFGIKMTAPADLNRAVSQWCLVLDKERQGKEQNLNVRVFECTKEDFATDVEITEVVKKVQKEDPRLAMRARRN